MSNYYFTSIVPAKEGGYICWFVDFEEAFTQGEDIAEAIEMSEDVLSIWAEEYLPVGKKELPIPSDISTVTKKTKEKIAQDKDLFDFDRDIIYQLIKLPNLDSKPVRIQVSLPANVLEQIDKKAEKLGLTRSKLLANGALAYSV